MEILKAGDLPGLNVPSRGLTVIPERDVYRLIIRSRLPSAERFEEWVVGEVLPTIREKGGYGLSTKLDLDKSAIAEFLGGIVHGVVQEAVQHYLPQAIDAHLTRDPQRAAVRHVPALQVAIDQGISKRPRGLVQKISGSLTRYCEQMNITYLRDVSNVKLFPKETIASWIAQGGWHEIEAYLIPKGVVRQLTIF